MAGETRFVSRVRATLDTNVLASAVLGRGGTPDLILRRWNDGAFELIISEPILRELERTLARPYFRRRLTDEDVRIALLRLRLATTMVPSPDLPEPVATHPADDRILATAEAGAADFLVTGDTQLLKLGEYHGIKILTPREFLAYLGGTSRSGQDESPSGAGA